LRGGGKAVAAEALEMGGEGGLVGREQVAAAGGGERGRQTLEIAAIGVDGEARAAALD
jgi:hypothetical protein